MIEMVDYSSFEGEFEYVITVQEVVFVLEQFLK